MGGTETQRFSTSNRLGLDTLDGLDSLDTLDGLDTLDKVEEVGFEVKETAPTAGYSVPDVPAADFDDLPCFEAPRKLFGSCHRARLRRRLWFFHAKQLSNGFEGCIFHPFSKSTKPKGLLPSVKQGGVDGQDLTPFEVEHFVQDLQDTSFSWIKRASFWLFEA